MRGWEGSEWYEGMGSSDKELVTENIMRDSRIHENK
jgi:hypothetical protein